MFYDEEKGGNREGSDNSAPKKRKRISTSEKYEKVKIGGSSPDGQRDRNPRYNSDRNKDRDFNSDRNPNYNSDRNPNYNSDRNPRYNSDRNRNSDNNGNRDNNFNRDRSRDSDSFGNRDRNYNRERSSNSDSYGNRDVNYNSDRGSRNPQRDGNREGFTKRPSFGSPSKSYGTDQRGGFKKTYGKPDGKSQFTKRGDKPYGKPGGGYRQQNDRYDNRPQRQPDYQIDEVPDNAPTRLNKYIANTGLCSRREADVHIQAGLITVNGNLITELGVKVLPTDDVRYNGVRLSKEKKVYILLNKPKDYVTSVDDPHAKRTIMELVQGACKERIYPVGRLDRMTTGVIMLTNDGELTKKLTHPTSEIKKIYQVYLDKNVNPEDVDAIADGITLEDGFVKADNVGYIREEDRNLIGIEIHSGRNRIVRRIFEHFGYKVTRLDRILFGGLTKKGLSRGQWRFLTPREVGFLKMLKV
jgi:23S rRNA pseudouridine2605 synthase